MFEKLEICILTQYQYILDEYEIENDPQEIMMFFDNYTKGCIDMFVQLNPNIKEFGLRPFFQNIEDPTPLKTIDEVYHWCTHLTLKLKVELEKLKLEQEK
ncbi:hypothetical protein [uncultured Shewanella sp.]|uniref:hypothetical protein n=1 Tax=uncultured Shewanella sp. TaxID=173975 RepID=UPI002626E191|nr:hypothetical protein [uncultured Shewanella sp.]